MTIATVNPATGETLETFEPYGDTEVDERLERAELAFHRLRRTTYAERAAWMTAAADLLRREVETVATTMTLEMGKTITAARAEVEKCARTMIFYADRAESLLRDEPLDDPTAVDATEAYVTYQPLGPILAVMPWNFPAWQVLRCAAPMLMAGNTMVLKHAPSVSRTALYLEDLIARAGFPHGSLCTLLIEVDQVPRVLADHRIRGATLTGSERAGSVVASLAGRALKKTVLELGGSDPFVVLPSANLEAAAAAAALARCQNNGQACIAGKRFIVHSACYDEFMARFVDHMSSYDLGDPLDPTTRLGPLATHAGRIAVEGAVDDAVAQGATVVHQGDQVGGAGFWFPATVLAGITPTMRAHSEEIFGPVATVTPATCLDEAVAVANATNFGLGASVWTEDPAEQEQVAREIDSGAVFVNGVTASYPELPFGGVKRSGYGRELGAFGVREFCNPKTIWVRRGR